MNSRPLETSLPLAVAALCALLGSATDLSAQEQAVNLSLRFDAADRSGAAPLLPGGSLGMIQDEAAAAGAEPSTDAPAPPADDVWTRPKILGDAWGVRPAMAEHGVSLDITVSQFYQSVVSGGRDTTGRYGGTVDWVLNASTEKMGLWKGGFFNVHARTRYGNDVLTAAGGLTLPNGPLLYPLPDDYSGTDVTGILYMQSLFDGKVQALVGKLDAYDLVSGFFPNTLDGGLKGFMNPYSTVATLPFGRYLTLSQWGGAAWTVDENGLARTGFVVFGPGNTSTTWDWKPSWSDGVGIGVFHRFTWKLDDKPGYLMLWGSGTNRDYDALEPIEFGVLPVSRTTTLIGPEPPDEDSPWGIAAYLHQVVWQDEGNDKRWIQVMLGGSTADDEVSPSNVNVFANVECFGPFTSRPNDRVGAAYWYNGLTSGLKDESLQLGTDLRDMWGFEFYYNYEVTPWFHVTPNLQVIQNEFDEDNTALVVGVRGVFDF